MADEDDIEGEAVEQPKNSQKGRAAHLAPWQFKKGQSGNPLGRTPGKSLKEFAKEYLASLTDDERIAYFEGMNKADIWKMAEHLGYHERVSHCRYTMEMEHGKNSVHPHEEDNHLGMEDPKCPNHLMSAARYFLTEMGKANADPEAEARLQARAVMDVAVTQKRLTQNGAR